MPRPRRSYSPSTGSKPRTESTDCCGRWVRRDLLGQRRRGSLRSTFKHECYYRHSFATKAEVVAAVDNWTRYSNHRRRHSSIGMRSPIDYELSLKAAAQASEPRPPIRGNPKLTEDLVTSVVATGRANLTDAQWMRLVHLLPRLEKTEPI
ncbi:integrase core domain-containing protein [Nocardia sp. FBN12]|uniref:integrase core domain-containing protein n=1 Tax=Nocardia sp. FBN12 TaxID=3419766 RepID=UPI003CFDF580